MANDYLAADAGITLVLVTILAGLAKLVTDALKTYLKKGVRLQVKVGGKTMDVNIPAGASREQVGTIIKDKLETNEIHQIP